MAAVDEAERALVAADEAWARLDLDGLVAHLSGAVRAFTAAGDPRRAAMTCARLGDVIATGLGNLTAGRAWFARARRLLADEPPCLEQGWVAVAAMGCDVDDPAELLAAAELALDRARRFGDVNLETKALADAGLAHVQSGRIDTGMALLDEAMALACGPADDGDAAAKSVCSFFTACYHAADFERAGSWAALLGRQGLIGSAPGGPIFLSSHCESVQAAMLVELGRWTEAEERLERARADFVAVMFIAAWHPDIALADLRVRQGRVTDAETLLLGKEQWMDALLPAARLYLARGEHELARRAAHRGLRAMRDDRLRAIELLTTLVDADLALGDLDAAAASCADLVARTESVDVGPLTARASAASARLDAARGDLAGAVARLEGALDALDGRRFPWLAATLTVELARVRERSGDRAGAAADAAAAAHLLTGLDVVVAPEDAALLHRLGAPDLPPRAVHAEPSHPGPTRPDPVPLHVDGPGAAAPGPRPVLDLDGSGAEVPVVTLTRAGGKGWDVAAGAMTARIPATKGMRYLAELVANPGVERHALDLVDRAVGVDAGTDGVRLDRRALGDAGALLDSRARTEYRRRMEELRADIDDALEARDLDGAERLQAELDALVRQLAAAFGLGGRDRTAASAAERARLNVTRALRTAIARLAAVHPDPAAHLDRSVRTGIYCAYDPAPDDRYRWIVQA